MFRLSNDLINDFTSFTPLLQICVFVPTIRTELAAIAAIADIIHHDPCV